MRLFLKNVVKVIFSPKSVYQALNRFFLWIASRIKILGYLWFLWIKNCHFSTKKYLQSAKKLEFICMKLTLAIHLNQFRNFSSMIFWKRLSERHSNCNSLQISNQLTWRIILFYFKEAFFAWKMVVFDIKMSFFDIKMAVLKQNLRLWCIFESVFY